MNFLKRRKLNALGIRQGENRSRVLDLAFTQAVQARDRARAVEASLDGRASVVIVATGIVIAANLSVETAISQALAAMATITATFSALFAVWSLVGNRRKEISDALLLERFVDAESPEQYQLEILKNVNEELAHAEFVVRRRRFFLTTAYVLSAGAFLSVGYQLFFGLFEL